MAYSRTYSETIHGSVQVTKQRVDSDGRVSSYTENVYWSEDVNIHVIVDDDPFNQSLSYLVTGIDQTTSAVSRMRNEYVRSKAENARYVGETLSNGFRKLIKSELDQQLVQLREFLPIKLLELEDLAQRCTRLQEQMSQDFQRIRDRYHKLFDDLDSELRIRILALDGRVFDLNNTFANTIAERHHDIGVGKCTISSRESIHVSASLAAAIVKQKVIGVVKKAEQIVQSGQDLRSSTRAIVSSTKVDSAESIHLPVAIIGLDETIQCIVPDSFFTKERTNLPEMVSKDKWRQRSQEELDCLLSEAERLLEATRLSPRERDLTHKLLHIQNPRIYSAR